jgi:post-segregation antitoxin (ccd killing protein)
MIPRFSRHALSRAQAEERLGRELRGDPSRGERAALQALALLDFDRVRSLLTGRDIGDDFRALLRERLEAAQRRGDKHFVVSILVSGNAYDHYARQARLGGLDISATLAAAVERDFARVRGDAQEADTTTAQLARYVGELVTLLKTGSTDPTFSERLASLHSLAHDLDRRASAAARTGGPS